MDWACLNDASHPPDDVERLARRTAEAEESRLISSYEHAVRRAASGNAHEAIESLRAVLAHALTNREDVSARLLRVKFLSLKNLGRLLDERGTAASEDDEAARTDREEAVRCYASAVEIDDTDALVWGRLGTRGGGGGLAGGGEDGLRESGEREPAESAVFGRLERSVPECGGF